MLLKLTLVPMREDRSRYSALVSYEVARPEAIPPRAAAMIGRNPAATGDFLVGVHRVREWQGERFGVTRVSQLRRVPGRLTREWPRKLDREPPESEELRRARIMAVRARVHVDPAIAAAEPDWNRALQLRLEAEAPRSQSSVPVAPHTGP